MGERPPTESLQIMKIQWICLVLQVWWLDGPGLLILRLSRSVEMAPGSQNVRTTPAQPPPVPMVMGGHGFSHVLFWSDPWVLALLLAPVSDDFGPYKCSNADSLCTGESDVLALSCLLMQDNCRIIAG